MFEYKIRMFPPMSESGRTVFEHILQ